MPFPSAASYTQTKWLAFFAELTAKLTHHNVLVAMEGAELLKRLLISRVSIAAVLQQGELLVRVLDSWRGCVTAVRPQAAYGAGGAGVAASSAAASLNDELGFVLFESISQCIDLMWSLYADGDPYYCLLVLARAGPMLEVLVDVLHTAPPQMYGITASLLQQLLALPLGHSDVELKVSPDGEVEGFAGLDKTTLAQIQKSVALRRHVRGLVEAVQEHGALLQHTTDVLAGLLAVQQGPRCLAAVFLFNLAAKRLRKFELRNASTSAEASPSPSLARGRVYAGSETQERTADNSELNVTITGAPQMPLSASAAGAATRTAQSTAAAASALDDLEEGVESSMPSTEPSALGEPAAQAAVKGAGTPSPSRPGGDQTQRPNSGSGAAADKKVGKQAEHAPPQDVSALVDDEPTRYSCTVPPSLAEETLRHLADSSNHDEFFDALDWLWCLTVADPMVVGAALTPAVFTRGLSRYLKAVPRTRRDCILFTLLLLWLGHLHSISALRRDTHRCLLEVAAASLLPMLHSELSKGSSAPAGQAATPSNASLNVSAIAPTMGASRATSAMALATSTGYSVPNAETNSFFVSASGLGLPRAGQPAPYAPDVMSWSSAEREAAMSANPPIGGEATLLPYAAARKAQEAALLLRPSIELILMAFLLNIYPGIEAEVRRAWVCQGRVLDMALTAVRRAGGVQSALLDTPTTIDGALSDEVYLDHALRSVRTDVTTVAVLGCRLMASVLSSELRWGSAWHDTVQEKKSALGIEVASTESEGITAAATHAEVALFTQAAMPLLVHIAVHNPDVSAAREGGAASPVHHVPLNLRCTRYTSLGESALVALDACLQYTAQMGDLRSRGGPAAAADATHITIEDVVRVLPALTRVSRNSVHPPVRAVPYRCLLYISQRIEDVLVVLRDMPSLANAAVSCVLDYSAVSSQWEVAAAAEWLTVLVDLLTAAEVAAATNLAKETAPPKVDTTHIGSAEDADAGAKQQRRLFAFASSTEQLLEYFHFDDSPLSRKLLTTIVSARRSNTGSVYAMSALLQLAVHLQTYVLTHQSTRQAINKRQCACANEAEKVREVVEESVVQPLAPAGLSSIPQWILLLQSTTAENARLSRICAAFHRSRQRQRKEEDDEAAADGGGREGPASFEDAATVKVHRQASHKAVLRDAWVRGVTASEQIALQYTFTATLFRALDMVLRSQYSSATASYGKHFSKALICGAVSAAVTLPPPHAVATLLAMRFHAATAPTSSASSPLASSPALVFGYQAAIQWACCVGSKWLRSAYPCGSGDGGLPDACKAALVEDFCTASETIMRDATLHLSERTRCQAAALLSAVIETCPASHLPVLEARGADLFSASTALRRTPGVSGLQCRLLRRVGSAARYAACAEHGWLQRNLEALRSTVERVKDAAPALVASAENHRAGSPRRNGRGNRALRRDQNPAPSDAASMARDLQAFQVLTSVLTSLVACVVDLTTSSAFSSVAGAVPQPAALLTAPQRQALCAVLCDALRVTSLRHCVLTSLRGMAETAEGRCCLLTDISTAGDPLGRNLFGRVLALTLHIPCKWAGISKGSHLPFTASPLSPSSTQQQQQQRSAPHRSSSASPRSLSPPLQSPRTPRAEKDTCHGAATDADPVVVVGCDICTTLLGRGCTSDAVSPSQESNVDTPTAVPNSSFLASFMKHRGLEYLAEHVALCVQQQRRHVRRVAVPQHFLRLLAALSLQVSVMGSIVKSADLFSAVLELAGMAFPPHCRTATLALLTLRNVCFDASLKSVLCQDDRVLLTLKAACLKLPCVSALLEDAPAASSSPAGQPKAAVEARASPNLRGGRRTRTEVMLRGDVVDPENATAVTWAKQMCVCARAWRSDAASMLNAEVADKPKGATSGASSSRAFFGDVTNTSPHAMMMDISALSLELNGKGETAAMAVATDAEATRRQYLAASALASLWFDHQRGKVAITNLLSTAPPLALVDVQALARFA